eukprot:4005026-Alexandrium_andersonii.AAC.1
MLRASGATIAVGSDAGQKQSRAGRWCCSRGSCMPRGALSTKLERRISGRPEGATTKGRQRF